MTSFKWWYLLFVPVILTIAYYSWNFQRKVNYNFSYQEQVEQTIKEKVKAECLR
jgi:hypothetical protein